MLPLLSMCCSLPSPLTKPTTTLPVITCTTEKDHSTLVGSTLSPRPCYSRVIQYDVFRQPLCISDRRSTSQQQQYCRSNPIAVIGYCCCSFAVRVPILNWCLSRAIPQIRVKKSVTEILLRRFCDRNSHTL